MGILSILTVVVIIFFIEKENIKKHWNKKEIMVFCVSLLFGAALCIAWLLEVDLINPLEILANIYRPISEPISTYINQFK